MGLILALNASVLHSRVAAKYDDPGTKAVAERQGAIRCKDAVAVSSDTDSRGTRDMEVDMAERTLRGARIGATSLQGEHGIEFAPRKRVEYLTDRGNRFAVMFDSEAEVPPEWFDPRSGELGFLDDEAGRVARAEFEEKGQNQRTHWDMLLERRSREELEELLEERLQVLRARRGSSK